jgi:putative inorganic carbon (hco3(-)) transporter
LLLHWQRGWVWHRTPLDGVMLLWIVAFGLSLLANLEVWRRISIGLWYATAYIGVWYMLHDLIANEGISRDTLVDGLLICGIIVLIFGYIQCREWFLTTLPQIQQGLVMFVLPRPVSTLGNTNLLSSFLTVLIPFIFTRVVAARIMFSRLMLGLYAILALGLMFLTFSRGAWLGLGVGLGAWLLLILSQHGLLSVLALRTWWAARASAFKIAVSTILLGGLVSILIVGLLFIQSFNQPGRTAGLRTNIYSAAVTLFTEKPFVGYGLFTFGRGLSRMQSMPPEVPHSHAHNAILHIGAELGIIGLVALFATLVVMGLATRRNWKISTSRQRGVLAASIGAVLAFAVHHQTDVPATEPAIALTGLLALVLMLTSPQPQPITSPIRRIEHPIAMVGLWLALLVSGFWSSQIYKNYLTDLVYGISTGDFRGSAERLQSSIDADPALSVYPMQQGFMWGMAASEGDMDAAQQAINVYEHFVVTEPYYAIVWANLGALYQQVGELDKAVSAMEQAVTLAPESWQIAINLGNYETAVGDTASAQVAYDEALRIEPDIILMPDLSLINTDVVDLSPPAHVVLLLQRGELDQAEEIWKDYAPALRSSSQPVIDALFALTRNDRAAAVSALDRAERAVQSETDEIWAHLGRARLADFDGNDEVVQTELSTIRDMLKRGLFEGDFSNSLIGYVQFLMNILPRDFLPQVYYPVDDPVLLYLIENT